MNVMACLEYAVKELRVSHTQPVCFVCASFMLLHHSLRLLLGPTCLAPGN